jgi:sorting nexin-25
VTLRDVLLNPSALGYFMEFMDRRKCSRLVQFWVTVESFKDPLADLGSPENDDMVRSMSGEAWPTAAEDISMIWDTYLRPDCPSDPVTVDKKLLGGIQALVEQETAELDKASPVIDIARRNVFQAQREAYELLREDHFPAFQASELFLKAATEVQRATLTAKAPLVMVAPPLPPRLPPLPQRRTSPAGSKGFPAWQPFRIGDSGHRRSSEEPVSPILPRSGIQDLSRKKPTPGSLHKTRSWSAGYALEVDTPSPSEKALEFLVGSSSPVSVSEDRLHRDIFNDDEGDASSVHTSDHLQPNGRLPELDGEQEEAERIQALQAALSSIIKADDADSQTEDLERDSGLTSRTSGHELRRAFTSTSKAGSMGSMHREDLTVPEDDTRASGGMSHNAYSRETSLDRPKKVFEDQEDDIPPITNGDEVDDLEGGVDAEVLQLAGPGDLFLTPDIVRVEKQIAKLQDQDGILDKMIRAAELTGKKHELALLVRSQKDLRQELRTIEFQNRQFIEQQRENRLVAGRTRAYISDTNTDSSSTEKQIVRYVIRIQQYNEAGESAHEWTISRRYNEFWDLHQELKESYVVGKEMRKQGIDLPGKKLVTSLSESFIDQRRQGLQDYLQV